MAKEDKKLSREAQIDDLQQRLAEGRALRLKLSQTKNKKETFTEKELRTKFEEYWNLNKAKFTEKSSKELEEVLWFHLKSSGYSSPEKFEEGIVHFGYKPVK
jgi:hypothetical protein